MGNEVYDVFVSYSRADWRHAVEIDSALRARGLKPFFDRRNLPPGLRWVPALEQAISASKAVLVLIGPRGFGNTQQYERDLAFFRQTRDPAFPVVPVILPEAGLDRPFNFLQILTWVDFSHVAKVSDAPDELERLLTAVQGKASADTTREAICPYRGLDAFREEDSAFFFGRGTADDPASPIGQLVAKVRENPFVMVVGGSGSGKSSLIYAGLMPALRRERDRFWNVLSLRPGPEPLRALAAAFNPRADDEAAAGYAAKIGGEAEKLRTGDPELLSHMIRQELEQTEGKPDRLLLYIDQWEELYAQTPSPSLNKKRATQHAADVNRFVDLLLAASQSLQVSVVATMRADFYGPLIGHPTIRELLPTQQVLLGLMSRSELERTIVGPAKKVGLAFDPPNLVARILDEAGEVEGMLPLLQYALKETWAFCEGNVITGDSYARSGGVQKAIRITAERTFKGLSPSDQRVARQLFLRLVTPGEGQEDTRARAAMPVDLAQRKIVEQFASQRTRLLVTGYDRAARPTVEVAHEALIRTWPRLRQWIDSNREKLRSRAAIVQAKTDWEQNGRRDDLLLPAGLQLERARNLLADPGDITIDDIQEFISLSSAREEAERKERSMALSRERQRLAEVAAAQKRTAQLQLRGRWTLTAMVFVVVLGLAAVGWLYRANLARQALLDRGKVNLLSELATSQRLRGNIDSALRLAVYAAGLGIRSHEDAQIGSLSHTALTASFWQSDWHLIIVGHEGAVRWASFSPDGSRIVTASDDKTARIWDAKTVEQLAVLRGHENGVRSASFSPDGSRIVTASDDKTARIWDAATGQQIAVLRGHEGTVNVAGFSPDGSRIITASADRTARIWNVATAEQVMVLSGGNKQGIESASFSPDGLRVVTSSSQEIVRTWDARTGAMIRELDDYEALVKNVLFSPDGSRLIVALADGTVRICDANTGDEIKGFGRHDGPIYAVAVSPDGSRVVTGSDDRSARIWDIETSKLIAVLRGHESIVWSVAFSPDRSRILTASDDKTVRIWDAAANRVVAVLGGHERSIFHSAVFSGDGRRALTASSDNTARIWDAKSAKEIAVLRGHEDVVNFAAFRPDDLRIVTASNDSTARIWDAESAKEIAILRGHEGAVRWASFSPDGSRIVTASDDKTARIWDAKTVEQLAVLRGHENGLRSASFSPDGSRIVTASDDKTARIWDAATGQQIAVLRGHDGGIESAIFGPDSSRIVTASFDATARVWNASTGKEIAVFREQQLPLTSAAFSRSGSLIATGSWDGTARVWDAATGREMGVLRGHTGFVSSVAFNPDGSEIITRLGITPLACGTYVL